MPIASFDVFDTVLMRAVGSPSSVFLLLGRYLAKQGFVSISAEAFARARMTAEERAYKTHGAAQTTLQHIYDELAYAIGFSSSETARIMTIECELEARLLRVIRDNLERVTASREGGDTIAFLSDMYLPAEFLCSQLRRHGLWQDADRLYVSCEVGQLKVTGGLFREFLRGEKATCGDISFHMGNHLEGDVRQAQRNGIRITPFLEGNLNRYEQILDSHAWRTEGLAAVFAGASRLARLSVPAKTPEDKIRRDVAAGVMGPVLTGFLLWVLRRAGELNLQRLYFISRDGEILLQIAQRLAQKLSSSLDIRYLYLSRQVLNPCGMVWDNNALWSWMWDQTDFLSVQTLLARVSVDPTEISDILKRAGFMDIDWNRNLTQIERAKLRALFDDKGIRQLIARHGLEGQEIVTRYLRQEGVLEDVPSALVDLGWSGSMQNALAVILAGLGRPAPLGFYFGLVDRPNETQFGIRECYFFDVPKRVGFFTEANDGWVQLLEAFCSATHGTVTDLIDTKSRVTPVLREAHNKAVLEWGLPIVQKSTCEFAEALELDSELVNPFGNVKECLFEVLNAFWANPMPEEVRVWGTFPWEDGLGNATYVNSLVKAFSWKDLPGFLRHGCVKYHHRAAWRQGCLLLSPWYIRVPLRALDCLVKMPSIGKAELLLACWNKAEIYELRGRGVASLSFRILAHLIRPERFRRTLDYFRRRSAPTVGV